MSHICTASLSRIKCYILFSEKQADKLGGTPQANSTIYTSLESLQYEHLGQHTFLLKTACRKKFYEPERNWSFFANAKNQVLHFVQRQKTVWDTPQILELVSKLFTQISRMFEQTKTVVRQAKTFVLFSLQHVLQQGYHFLGKV